MALHWRPVGPEPAPTYWQRRAVVVVALLLLVLFLRAVLTVSGGTDTVAGPSSPPGSGAASPRASASPDARPSTSASPAASPSVAPAVACLPASLEVAARAERDDYPVGGRPLLVLTITNTGALPCTRDLGQGAVELTVVSGPDRIWSSDDCAPGGPAKQVVLDPGEPSVTRLTWAGTRSRPGCEGDKAVAQAGTYRVGARLGELRFEGRPFRVG